MSEMCLYKHVMIIYFSFFITFSVLSFLLFISFSSHFPSKFLITKHRVNCVDFSN